MAPLPSSYTPPRTILLFLVALTMLRLAIAGGTGLVFDEAYYRLWGLFPAWGYFDHAPMVVGRTATLLADEPALDGTEHREPLHVRTCARDDALGDALEEAGR